MIVPYTRWPDDLATCYRRKGYWLDLPLTDISDRQRNNPAVAIRDQQTVLTYQQLATNSDQLAACLQRAGLKKGILP